MGSVLIRAFDECRKRDKDALFGSSTHNLIGMNMSKKESDEAYDRYVTEKLVWINNPIHAETIQ